MSFYYSPLDPACKSVVGAVARSSKLTLNIYREHSGEDHFSAALCSLIIFRDGEGTEEFPMTQTDFGYSVTLKINQIGLYFY
ncbi:MAG: hypothetical protein K2L87_01605, partial [Clostridiales bacterium]|nr:hypothetical protein [Clostridiales bacterium]